MEKVTAKKEKESIMVKIPEAAVSAMKIKSKSKFKADSFGKYIIYECVNDFEGEKADTSESRKKESSKNDDEKEFARNLAFCIENTSKYLIHMLKSSIDKDDGDDNIDLEMKLMESIKLYSGILKEDHMKKNWDEKEIELLETIATVTRYLGNELSQE